MSNEHTSNKGFATLGKAVVFVALAFIGLIGYYQLIGQNEKDAFNKTTASLGFGTQIAPWEDRADTMSRSLIERNKEQLASAIQGITHPTGKKPTLDGVKVSKLNSRLLVELNVNWKGGFVGTNYQTQVAWEFSEDRHDSAKVTLDSSMTGVLPKNAEQLDDYFRTKIYPVLLKDMGS